MRANLSARSLLGTPPGDGKSPFVPSEIDKHASVALHNLQNDLETLARLLPGAMQKSSLDAYLLAAGMNQIAEDYLHPEIYPFDRAAEYLGEQAQPLGRIVSRAAAGFATASRMITTHQRINGRVLRWQRELGQLVDALAREVIGGALTGTGDASMLRSHSSVLHAVTELPVRLRRKVIQLPACFQSFDQQPADLGRLVGDLGGRRPRRSMPLLVVGVRTSGSYLAPLCAAFLKADGYERVRVLTIRPGRPLLKHERELVRSMADMDGLALVTDDPPVTGKGIARSARELETAGFAPESVVLLLQVFGTGLPALLNRYPAVLLRRDEWAVSARLTPEAVERELSALVGPTVSVVEVEPVSPPAPHRPRGHCRALFRVRLAERPGGPHREERVAVEGVGLGYLGSAPLAAARALDRFSPKLFGVREGLLYREWLPDERRVGALDLESESSVTAVIASYVSERRRALPVSEDISLRLVGQLPAWEVASTIVSHAFGRTWPLAKVLVMDRVVRRLLRVEQPSVVDGGMDLDHWFFRERSERSLVKVQPAEGSFSNLGLSCFDPAFDLAGTTARARDPSFVRSVRKAYEELGNSPVDEERLLLYELAHLWRRQRKHPEEEVELRRARSRALQRYFADVYFRDVEASSSGPLCALDVDGVLETEHLGFPALTPVAGRTLRALMLHGYRTVLVSGRSVDEIAERCRIFGLAGGVAEYGAAYVSGKGHVSELLPDGAGAVLGRLRSTLSEIEGVHLDGDYRLAVRAYRVDGRGSRRGLPIETIAACLEQTGIDRVRPIPGEGQTDFMIDGVDKATGLCSLAGDLGFPNRDPGTKPFALAVGDAVADIPCATLATLACAPAHAHPRLRNAGFEIMKAPYQAGLAEAVARLLGHSPGGCSVCRPQPATPERNLLLTALAAPERGRWSMVIQAGKLAVRRR